MKRKLYLNGWVWGCERIPDGYTIMNEERNRYGIWYSKVYPTKETAIKAIQKQVAETKQIGWKYFYRGQIYETHIPEHAKGLPLWESSMGENIYVCEK